MTTPIRNRSLATVATGVWVLLIVSLAGVEVQQRSGRTPNETDVLEMLKVLPATAPARPARPRRVLVLANSPGFTHSSIPLAARTIEELGRKTGAWSTAVSYDPGVITSENLMQYDAIVLDSTVGAFLDEAGDPGVSDSRRAAFLAFVRGGKGLVGIHGATDTYHSRSSGTWPEFNQMIGGIFKSHPWQKVPVKIDDPASPLTSMFTSRSFEFQDEIYSFYMDSWSRKNVRVLMSIDYAMMRDEDKALESNANARTDGDYGLSWIRREGLGRVFYLALGHREDGIFRSAEMLQHLLAGTQYAIGDLKADDSPSRLRTEGATASQGANQR